MAVVDMEGLVFGRLTVSKRAPNMHSKAAWHCVCSCGQTVVVVGQSLRRGVTKSCGCLASEKRTTHGLTSHPLYQTWGDMKNRCRNPNHKYYASYGGRGLTVCPEWLDSFETFLRDMGEKPTEAHSIDRINNELGYSKENCRWATNTEQALNKRPRKSALGIVNVRFLVREGRRAVYRVDLTLASKNCYVGDFKTIPEAIAARDSFRQQNGLPVAPDPSY